MPSKYLVKKYKGVNIYCVYDHYEIEDCGKEFASISECKRFINFMEGKNL